MKNIPLVECWNFVGATPQKFDGEKRYISTGALEKDHINEADVEMVTFNNRPSRANLEVNSGDILFAKMASTEKTFVVDSISQNDIYSTGFCAVRANESKILSKCLYYFLSSSLFLEQKDKNSSGATQKAITNAGLSKIYINLPELTEQQEFIEQMDSLTVLITARREQLAKLDELVKSRFIELLHVHPTNNQLADFVSSYKAERCGDRDLPVLSITKEDGIVFQNEKFKKRIASVDASTYKVVPRGKLVQGIHIDERNFAIQNIANEGIVSPAYKIWNVDEEKAIPEVLAYAMRTDRTMAYISSKFTGSVKRRESISMDDFMATPIDLPNIKVQAEFYAFMKQTDKSKFEIQKSLEKLETLKKALMQKYFGG